MWNIHGPVEPRHVATDREIKHSCTASPEPGILDKAVDLTRRYSLTVVHASPEPGILDKAVDLTRRYSLTVVHVDIVLDSVVTG